MLGPLLPGRKSAAGMETAPRALLALFPLRVQLGPGVLHHLESLELDIGELAVFLLDAADIDVLDDLTRLGVDREGAARAFIGLVMAQEA